MLSINLLAVDLVYSAILLIAANVAVRRPPTRVGVLLLGVGGPSCHCACFLPPGALQTLFLLVAYAWHKNSGRTPRQFLAASVGSTLLAYAIIAVPVVQYELGLRDLRGRYPFESLEGRVPELPPGRVADPAPKYDPPRLEEQERSLNFAASHHGSRNDMLAELHDDAVRSFVNGPGFGIVRMMRVPNEHNLANGLRPGPTPPQPGGALSPPLPALKFGTLGGLHDAAALDFLHPQGFGYFRDRKRVAGFQSHRFGEVPTSSGPVGVARVELVSLLLHETPAVYVSDRLPAMDELAGVPTRPLDDFEADGLAKLRRGEELAVDGVRMLGALRSAKQCVACHGGERGELLGALSYGLREKRLKPPKIE